MARIRHNRLHARKEGPPRSFEKSIEFQPLVEKKSCQLGTLIVSPSRFLKLRQSVRIECCSGLAHIDQLDQIGSILLAPPRYCAVSP